MECRAWGTELAVLNYRFKHGEESWQRRIEFQPAAVDVFEDSGRSRVVAPGYFQALSAYLAKGPAETAAR